MKLFKIMVFTLMPLSFVACSAKSVPIADSAEADLGPREMVRQGNEMNAIYNNLLSRCLKKEGFRFVPPPVKTAASYQFLLQANRKDRRLFRKTFGYAHANTAFEFLRSQGFQSASSGIVEFREKLDPAAQSAFDASLDMCSTSILNDSKMKAAVDASQDGFKRRIAAEKSNVKANKIFSQCFRERYGKTFADRQAFTAWFQDGTFSQDEEAAVAIAEYDCSELAGLDLLLT
jgi:hypothetical protein